MITPDLLIDTKGPVIDGLFFNRLNGQVDYIIKDPGSTPSSVWLPSILDSANYQLTKVYANKADPGKWIVTEVTAAPDPTITNAIDVAVTFNSGAMIKGGYYLFTIRGSSSGNASVQDLAGNHLDGEFYGSFPSGNGINGGDFVAETPGLPQQDLRPPDDHRNRQPRQWRQRRPTDGAGAQQNPGAGHPAWRQPDLLDIHQPVQWRRPARRHRAQDP